MHYMNEYQYNDGYYFEHCEYPNFINHKCKYLDFGCTGCLSVKTTKKDRNRIELVIKAIDNISNKIIKKIIKPT